MRTTDDFFAELWARREEATKLIPRGVRYLDNSHPKPSDCHNNVDRWVEENDGCEAVRGWIPMTYGFERHSVVRDPSGALVDITLGDSYGFLIHDEEQAPFTWFAERGVNQIFWPRNPP